MTSTASKLTRLITAKNDIKEGIENLDINMDDVLLEDYASKLVIVKGYVEDIKEAIEYHGIDMDDVLLEDYASKIEEIVGSGDNGGGSVPTGSSGFTGATIPLTYYNLANPKEKTLEYKSAHKITISGLEGRAAITGNGTNSVSVEFDVSSQVSSLKNFTISLDNGTSFKGMHAHYGSNVTSNRVLVFAYKHITPDGTEGTIDTNYMFIYSDTLPLFSDGITRWNDIYSYQLLNVLMGNWSRDIRDYFLYYAYSFNQPLDLSNATSIGSYFLRAARSFNQPLDISNFTSIGDSFLESCVSFNQPLDISNVTSIGNNFLYSASSFNQPLDLSNATSIGNDFLRGASSFNQPLDISNVTSIGNNFLVGANSFNQPLDLSNVTSIGNDFLGRAYSFNQPLIITNITRSFGSSFLNNCYSLSAITWNSNKYPTDNSSLSQDINSKTNSSNGEGIKVYGTYRTNLMSALSNSTTKPFRKLINGGS